MEEPIRTDVVIVGAGPTGLSLACQFIRFGTKFIIIEKNGGVTPYSKAIGVHARTLEIYDQIGLANRAIEEGAIAGKARFVVKGDVRGEIDLSHIGEGLSPFPFVLMLEQSKNEQLLYDYLRSYGGDVLWNTELEDFTQDSHGATVRLKTADGVTKTVEARYVVGCDGPRSSVREKLGLAFEGATDERIFYVADALIDWDLSHEALHVCFATGSFALFFPLRGENRYRIVGVLPEEIKKEEDLQYLSIEKQIRDEIQLRIKIHDVEWFSTYRVHSRHAERFSKGRGFLAGDAAHIHTPAGAQGMNTGIQDAYNLAWKMALVLNGDAAERLLETYNEERLENARHLLRTTDRLFEFGAGKEGFSTFIRTEVLPPIAKYLLGLDAVKKKLFPLLSQTGINYRASSLSVHEGSDDLKVKAGDRMPYFRIDGQSVYDRLRSPKFHFFVFYAEKADLEVMNADLGEAGAGLVETSIIRLQPEVAEIFGADQSFSVLLRPDNYIGLIAMIGGSPHEPAAYLKRYIEHSGLSGYSGQQMK